jgi:membrane associated rhomboid family serine protease
MDQGQTLALYGLIAFAVGGAVRVIKSDRIPINVPPAWRPVLAVALGLIGGGFAAAATGTPAKEAILGGLGAGAVAIVGHVIGVEWLRNGRELGVPKPKHDPEATPVLTDRGQS